MRKINNALPCHHFGMLHVRLEVLHLPRGLMKGADCTCTNVSHLELRAYLPHSAVLVGLS